MIDAKLQLNSDTVYVYVAKFDLDVEVQPVQPAIRNQAIERCADALTRRQRFCVWRLLDYALKEHCGKGVDGFNFDVDTNGKWTSNAPAHFSLSHSNNVVAVALSAHNVGVDIEAVGSFADRASDEAFVCRVLNDAERQVLECCEPSSRDQQLAMFWTRKESVFKLDGGTHFIPKNIDTTCPAPSAECTTGFVTIDGNEYALSGATRDKLKLTVQVVDI